MKTIELNSYDVVELNSEEALKVTGGEVVTLIVIFLIGVLIGVGIYEKAS
jgi:hypothetical protein